MQVSFHRDFKKSFKKLPIKVKTKFAKRLELLLEDADHPLLRVHTLKGGKYPLESMNVTADYRALFLRSKIKVTFYEIGSHSELYE